jgi:glyoxylase I family protein
MRYSNNFAIWFDVYIAGEAALTETKEPVFTRIDHVSLTVTDLESSVAWYQRVFRTDRLDVKIPHHGREETGYSVLLPEPRTGLIFGLHTNTGNRGEPFDEARTGLDHISFRVSGRADLVCWTGWLDELGIEHTGIVDETEPIAYSTVVFRDPDNIQLELIFTD